MRFNKFSMSFNKVNENRNGEVKKMPSNKKSEVNKDLSDLLQKINFGSIPLDNIFELLEMNGLVPLQDDNTEWSGILTGDNGKINLKLGDETTKYKFNEMDTYIPFSNTSLTIVWNRMEGNSKKYEVKANVI